MNWANCLFFSWSTVCWLLPIPHREEENKRNKKPNSILFFLPLVWFHKDRRVRSGAFDFPLPISLAPLSFYPSLVLLSLWSVLYWNQFLHFFPFLSSCKALLLCSKLFLFFSFFFICIIDNCMELKKGWWVCRSSGQERIMKTKNRARTKGRPTS